MRCYAILISVLLLLGSDAFAGVYRYVDQAGKVHFTDELSEVPEAQRPPAARDAERASQGQAPAEGPPAEVRVDSSDGAAVSDETRQALTERLEQIEKEYQELMQQRAALEKRQDSVRSRLESREVSQAVEELNAKIADYQQRREALNADVADYNAQLKAKKEAPAN